MKLWLAAIFVLAGVEARAESWCAYPLWVHEWGVHVLGADDRPGPPLPDWFHHDAPSAAGSVRNLPADNGVRKLPVLHFYSRGSLSQPIPVGIEVGFTHGPASSWFPQVDHLVPAETANSAAALAAHAVLVERRKARQQGQLDALPADPRAQLVWDHLELTPRPARPASPEPADWVTRARGLDALWVNGASESERFVFYEATTHETSPLVLTRGPGWSATRRQLVLTNSGAHALHDVFMTVRDGAVFVVHVPELAAKAQTTFVLEDQRVAPDGLVQATRGALAKALLDPNEPSPPAEYRWSSERCVMMRDPAQPFERSAGSGLYQGEVDLIVAAWGARFFDQPGTTVVYREDVAALDEAMPLAIYTDMFNFVVLHRAGLALWENVALP